MSQLGHGLRLDLADPLTAQGELRSNGVEGARSPTVKAVTQPQDGTLTIEFTSTHEANDWQPALWQAVLSHGATIRGFTQVRGQTLRDVIRYFSSDHKG